jgi:TonB-linked SusC/RagA family outer membrane protein
MIFSYFVKNPTILFEPFFSFGANAQTEKVSLKFKNVAVEKVLNAIESQTSYRFLYNKSEVDVTRKVSLSVKNQPLSRVLSELFAGNEVSYRIVGRQIVLNRETPQEEPKGLPPVTSSGHRKVTGIVTDAKGEPIIGASIAVKGTNIGTTSGIDGKFDIPVNTESVILEVSYVGYRTQKIPVYVGKYVNAVMNEDNTLLNEVVVVGYGTQKKVSLTSAVSSIVGDDVVTTKNENVQNMLTGKVAGLQVIQKTAEPGEYNNNMYIRGMGSPLVVIDGVQMGDFSVLQRMDPNDIESVSVLKDASAAVYGVKAANGVILITTKKGKSGSLQLEYSGTMGSQVASGLPKGVDAVQYMTLANELSMHNSNGGKIVYTAADFAAYENGTLKSTDVYDAVFSKSALQEQHNLTASGGNNQTTYLLSVGYTQQDGLLQSGDLYYKRYNVRSNVTSKIGKDISVNLNLSGIMDQKDAPSIAFWQITKEAWRQRPTQSIYANDNPDYYSNGIVDGGNAVAYSNSDVVGYQRKISKYFDGSISIDYKFPFIEGLDLKGFYSYNDVVYDNKVFSKTFNLYTYNSVSDIYSATAYNSPTSLTRTYYDTSHNMGQLSLNYAHTFNNSHNVSALLLYEGNTQKQDNFSAYRQYTIPIDQIMAGNSANQQATQNSSGVYDYATNSIVGRFTYDYKSRYLAEFSFRDDESSKFSSNHRWGFFPSGSVGWRVSEENFWQKSVLSFIDNFKLRASYGVLGDDGSLSYQFLTGYTYPATGSANQLPGGSVFGNSFVNAVQSKGLANTDITWSTSRTFDVGLDLDIWNGLLSFTYDFFVRNRSGLFATSSLQVSDVLGASLPQENLNGDRTKGFDLTVGHKNHIGKFNYNINGTLSFARSMWRNYAETKHGNSYLDWLSSQSYRNQGLQWGIGSSGQYQNYSQILNSPIFVGRGTVVGDYIYQDWNGDGVVDANDTHIIGANGSPKTIFGLSIGGNYKEFDFNLLFQGSGKTLVMYPEQLRIPLQLWNGSSALTQFMDDWHPVDPNADPFNPNTVWASGHFSYTGTLASESSLFAFQNAAYVRLKSVEIGYTLPKRILSHVGLKDVRVFANGYNILTWTKLKYVDPEHPTDTYGYLYPIDKLFNMGIDVKF